MFRDERSIGKRSLRIITCAVPLADECMNTRKIYLAVPPEIDLVFLIALPPEAYESRQFELSAILYCRAWHIMID